MWIKREKFMIKLKLTVIAAILFASNAYAGDCVIKINRTACPGKTTEAYKPYNGKVETEEKKSLADQKACEAEAEKASKIVRKGVLTQKRTIASFDGKDSGKSFTGTAECK